MTKSKLIVNWTLRIIVALGFGLASMGKLLNSPEVIKMFKDWGFPDGFYFIIGILELLLAILLLIPRTSKIAVYGLVGIMIGAVLTHLLNDPISEIIRPVIFLALLAAIYVVNKKRNTIGMSSKE